VIQVAEELAETKNRRKKLKTTAGFCSAIRILRDENRPTCRFSESGLLLKEAIFFTGRKFAGADVALEDGACKSLVKTTEQNSL
jgi:hypothetical protein